MNRKKRQKVSPEQAEVANPVPIYASYDKVTTELILSTLERNHIPAYRQAIGEGHLMNVYMGSPLAGEEIYVAAAQADQARQVLELLGLVTEAKAVPGSPAGYSRRAVWAARIALVVVISLLLFGLLYNLL